MQAVEADFKRREDPHGYVLQGAPWGSGMRVVSALFALGMQEGHDVLDFGCGALRVGGHLILYLEPGHYFGIEPSEWAVKAGIKKDGLESLVRVKKPTFVHPGYDTFDARAIEGQTYDWILFSGVLTHMDHDQLRSSLYSAAKVLRPGGSIVGSYLPEGPDHEASGWLYPQQAPHYRSCIKTALANTPLTLREVSVPGDPAQWFDAWFEAR